MLNFLVLLYVLQILPIADAEDLDVLKLFYTECGGGGWNARQHWMSEESYCNWDGVTCDGSSRVSRLDFENNQHTGKIPTELGRLTGITGGFMLYHTSWSSYGHSGEIPTELGELTGLTENFMLTRNTYLTGKIPTELGRLTLMESGFSLYINSLTGEIPSELGKMTGMTKDFNLGSNYFCGPEPTWEWLSNVAGPDPGSFQCPTTGPTYHCSTEAVIAEYNSVGTPCPTTAPTAPPTAAPTATHEPSATHAPTTCVDSNSFYFSDTPKRTCEWAAKNPSKRCNRPVDDTYEVKANCPVTCGTCSTRFQSCSDSTTFYLGSKTHRDCRWARGSPAKRCNKHIDENFEVQTNCPIACDTCP